MYTVLPPPKSRQKTTPIYTTFMRAFYIYRVIIISSCITETVGHHIRALFDHHRFFYTIFSSLCRHILFVYPPVYIWQIGRVCEGVVMKWYIYICRYYNTSIYALRGRVYNINNARGSSKLKLSLTRGAIVAVIKWRSSSKFLLGSIIPNPKLRFHRYLG